MSDHPEIELLKNYLNNSAATEFSEVRLHIAQCSQCRTQVEGLMGLQQVSEQSGDDALSDQQHQQIADYIDGRLSETEYQQQKEFLHSNPAAMKAALHYASHKSAMDKSISDPASVSSSNSVSGGLWASMLTKFKALLSLQTSVWLTVPATAALVAILSISLFNQPVSKQSMYSVASYQDNAVIQFSPKNNLPGIGFFVKSNKLSKPYEGLKVSVSDGRRFTIQWPQVPGAIKYSLRLQMFDQGNKIVIGEVTTEKNSAVFSVEPDNIYHRYEWVLSGETQDDRVFFTNGGFVINELQKVLFI